MCLKHPTRDICVLLVPHARSVARPQMWQCAVQPSSCGDLITVWALRVFGPQNIIHFLLNSLSKCIIFSFIWHRFKCKLHILFHCIFFNHIGSFDTFISSLSWRLCPSLLNILLSFVFWYARYESIATPLLTVILPLFGAKPEDTLDQMKTI